MIKFFSCVIFIFFCSAVDAQTTEVPILDFEGIRPYLEKNNDTVYVVNFWATWCKPCVEELPFFEQLHQDQINHPVQVILVSLDFRKQIEMKLIPFINEYSLQSKVILLDDPDANSWIDQVDESWSGAIPVTLVYKREKRLFFNEEFEDYESIKSAVERVR
jgi:thiol-disulfide isomerase/thioredoxin